MMAGDEEFASYYGNPIINKPVWRATDIAGYFFLGGLAGASSLVAAGAHITRRQDLARAMKVASTAAAGLSGAALVHDLGRPGRFFNMLRVFKPTSPMSVGSWLLVGYSPLSAVATWSAVTEQLPVLGATATFGAAALGSLVCTYTAALLSDTAVPAWHEGHKHMPFVFAASSASAAAGLGMVASPVAQTAPLRLLGPTSAVAELALIRLMKRDMGEAAGAFNESQKGHRYGIAATALTALGAGLAATLSRRRRSVSAVAGAALMAGSALTRFAIFEAGVVSAENPRYTVVPQKRRRDREVE
jgi:formate-dependent nitrite reductase membrane component NrfD